MAATDINISEADDQIGEERNISKPLFIASAIICVLLGLLAGGAAMSYKKDIKMKEDKRLVVQRELRAYADFQDLPLEDINVSYAEDGSLVVNWRQDNQSCTSPAVRPQNDSLWSAKPVTEGSGGCQTASGSGGIGNFQNP